ncbi:stage V sporulation protein AA [Bacillus alkalicellulosilyticus]|uniref:stage V sporulation protein AA n=1 Tax=Alkalihalobacterium alkalicellulosilyticum TaxID=1912214 RepID=UPI0009986D1B|nr:stage V sporulation protein AA [Bacillus alkalicellulosilyticus]
MGQSQSIYIRMRHHVRVNLGQNVTVGDVAQVIAEPSLKKEIDKLIIHRVKREDKNFIIIDVMAVIETITTSSLHVSGDIQSLGNAQSILEVEMKQRKLTPILFCLIWLLLFFGAALAIMNFHEDVSMREVHQRIFKVVTGNESAKPLLLQIPYSIGLGLGMILFFNHVFKKRINEEPSPLEVEMFKYQQDLNQYLIIHENKENKESEKKSDGD